MPKNNQKKKQQLDPVNPSATNQASTSASSRADDSKVEYPLSAGQIIVEQNDEIRRQDEQLVDLEASVGNLREASININQELTLQNRLLEDVHDDVDRVQLRQVGTQDRLTSFMRRSGTCKLWMTIIMLALLLVLLIVILK